jgi:hypothetical protein
LDFDRPLDLALAHIHTRHGPAIGQYGQIVPSASGTDAMKERSAVPA